MRELGWRKSAYWKSNWYAGLFFGLDSHCPSGWGKVWGMKLKNAEIGREKLNGSTVKSLDRWTHPRGDGQVVEHPGRSSFVKLCQTLEFKKRRAVTGQHGPLVPRRSQTAGTGQTCRGGVGWFWRRDGRGEKLQASKLQHPEKLQAPNGMRAHEHFHKRSNERARLAKKHQNYETKPILKCKNRLILPI
jgi:hypothetical protein